MASSLGVKAGKGLPAERRSDRNRNVRDLRERGSVGGDHLTACAGPGRTQEGSAIIEFLALAVLLLIPAVWFLLAVAQIQSALYAATGAADQAARIYVTSEAAPERAAQHSQHAVETTLADYGINPAQAQITHSCTTDCQNPGDMVRYQVEIRVPLPLVPEFGGWEHSLVTVTASSTALQGE